jgi:hypothetical protein
LTIDNPPLADRQRGFVGASQAARASARENGGRQEAQVVSHCVDAPVAAADAGRSVDPICFAGAGHE